jgi:hypothetical protein
VTNSPGGLWSELSDAAVQCHGVIRIPFLCPLSAWELLVSFVHDFDVSVRGDHTEI